MSTFEATLTIGDVADRAQVSIALLRAWERRYGFPTPERRASGHRRYTGRHVEQIRDVLVHRDSGMTLDAAIRSVRDIGVQSDRSVFAGLRRRWPQLPVTTLSQRAMLAVSHAIEDECCAVAQRPVLVGSFQTDDLYRRSEHRWQELGRKAAAAVVFADFPGGRRQHGNVLELPVPYDSALHREWFVICDAVDAAACLVGTERLTTRRSAPRRTFEAVWSVDPAVVRSAAELANSLDEAGTIDLMSRVGAVAERPDVLWARVAALTTRIVHELDR